MDREMMWAEEIGRLGDAVLARLDAAVGRVARRLRREVPGYDSVPEPDLRVAVAGSVMRGLNAVRERRHATESELQEFAVLAELRARQGLPVETVMHGYHLAIREVWDLVTEVGREIGIDPDRLLEAARLIWDWADDVTLLGVLAHRRAEIALARHDQGRRASFLRAVLHGAASEQDLRIDAGHLDIEPEGVWVPFRARPIGHVSLAELEHAAVEAAGTGGRSVVAVLDGDVAGIASGRFAWHAPNAAVGFGPPAPLGTLPASYRLASRALEAAARFRLRGAFALEELPLRAVVAVEEEIGRSLVARFLEPLEREGGFGDVIRETLERFFAEGMNAERVARGVGVHPNTLRHRLHRFEELTGARLGRVEDLFQIWWALERRRLDGLEAGEADSVGETDGREASRAKRRSRRPPS